MTDDRGLSRRHFLQGVGAGAVAAGALAGLEPRAEAKVVREPGVLGPDPVQVKLDINGAAHDVEVEPRATLLDTLRNRLDLTGSKKVCDRATCGACTVLVDGKAMYSCTLLAVNLGGRKIETVESLASGGQLCAIQSAFVKNDAQQCGFCTPGFVVACESFLRHHKSPAREDVLDGLGGNLCRCGTYVGVTQAVLDAAKGGK